MKTKEFGPGESAHPWRPLRSTTVFVHKHRITHVFFHQLVQMKKTTANIYGNAKFAIKPTLPILWVCDVTQGCEIPERNSNLWTSIN